MSKASGEKNLEAQEKKSGKTAAETTAKAAAAKKGACHLERFLNDCYADLTGFAIYMR